MSISFDEKKIIGMIHLQNISNLDVNYEMLENVFQSAKNDLMALQEGGADAAIVENFFDAPYSTKITIEQIIAYTDLFSRLRSISRIPLGVNIQQTNGIEEIAVATLSGGAFIRSEAFVETRVGASGILEPQASKLMQYKRNTNSDVNIFADINVKHSQEFVSQPIEDTINDAINAGADAVIITGKETGKNPETNDIKEFKKMAKKTPVIVGSGVNLNNIKSFLQFADGVIVGSSIKEQGLESQISLEKVREIVEAIKQ